MRPRGGPGDRSRRSLRGRAWRPSGRPAEGANSEPRDLATPTRDRKAAPQARRIRAPLGQRSLQPIAANARIFSRSSRGRRPACEHRDGPAAREGALPRGERIDRRAARERSRGQARRSPTICRIVVAWPCPEWGSSRAPHGGSGSMVSVAASSRARRHAARPEDRDPSRVLGVAAMRSDARPAAARLAAAPQLLVLDGARTCSSASGNRRCRRSTRSPT